MRASDHFYSELDIIARKNGADLQFAERSFARLSAPVVGEVAAEELFRCWAERHAATAPFRWEKLGHIASFVLGDYDDSTMDLDAEDWSAIRDIVTAEAEEMDMDELTRLMTTLVSHGALS